MFSVFNVGLFKEVCKNEIARYTELEQLVLASGTGQSLTDRDNDEREIYLFKKFSRSNNIQIT